MGQFEINQAREKLYEAFKKDLDFQDRVNGKYYDKVLNEMIGSGKYQELIESGMSEVQIGISYVLPGAIEMYSDSEKQELLEIEREKQRYAEEYAEETGIADIREVYLEITKILREAMGLKDVEEGIDIAKEFDRGIDSLLEDKESLKILGENRNNSLDTGDADGVVDSSINIYLTMGTSKVWDREKK
jgi:hypothetical protein